MPKAIDRDAKSARREVPTKKSSEAREGPAAKLSPAAETRESISKKAGTRPTAAPIRQSLGKDEMSTGVGRALRMKAINAIGSPAPAAAVGFAPVGYSGHRDNDDAAVGSPTGTVKFNAAGDSIDGSVKVEGDGWGVHFGANVSATKDVKHKNGVTTLTTTSTLTVSAGANVEAGVFSAGVDAATGVKTTYQVKLSDADYDKVKAGAPSPDPYNPSTLPVGSVVLMTSTDFAGTKFEAGYRALQVSLGLDKEHSVSTTIEKLPPNVVRVTAGPSDLVKKNFTLGVKLGPASVSLGSTQTDQSFTLKTAEFNLDTQAGRDAYQAFLTSGKLPEKNGPGVANVAKIQRDTEDWSLDAGAKLGPIGGSVNVNNSNWASVVTTYPDGSRDRVIDFQGTDGASPLHAVTHYRPDGTEDLSKSTYSYFFKGASGDVEGLFAYAFGFDPKTVKGSKDINLTFTPEQTLQLAADAAAWVKATEKSYGHPLADGLSGTDALLKDLSGAKTPEQVAAILSRYPPGTFGVMLELLKVSGNLTACAPPGTISVVDRNTMIPG